MKNRKLTIILIITIFFSVILFNYDKPIIQERKSIDNCKTNNGTVKAPLIYGLSEGASPAVLDPVDSWNRATNDVIRHVCDNLWYPNLSDPDLALEWQLATNYSWDPSMTELTVTLRQGVYFHDGTLFTAEAVKYTFDRITYFINATGTLPDTTHTADPASLFFDMNGDPILKKTVINSEYNVTFVLNKPNGVFINLLTYDACAILHPASTSATEYLELGVDKLIGTGPFKYVHLLAGEEMKFERWEYYWGETVYWDEVIWVYYPDSVTAGNALLGGEVDKGTFPTSMIAEVIANEDLVFVNMESSFIYRYIGFNNAFMNRTDLRKAIAYAYNYTYFVDVVMRGYAIRAKTMVPPGFPYYNATFASPYWNTSIARATMLLAAGADGKDITGLDDRAVGVDSTNDANWLAKNFYTFKFYIPEGSTTITEMGIAFNNDMNHIGVSVTNDVMDWETYIWTTVHDPDRLNIFYTGWGPDYMDPWNMIEPLLNNKSNANHIQVQDYELHKLLWEYEATIPKSEGGPDADNPALFADRKEELVYLIQNRALNELYVELACTYDMILYGHTTSLTGIAYNLRGDLWHQYSYMKP